MPRAKTSNRTLKCQIAGLLRSEEADKIPEALGSFSRHQVIRVLFSFLCDQDRVTRWRVVATMGYLVALLAEEDLEKARDVVRRLMWILNEESGSSGWGAPEAIAEIMARHDNLAKEYAPIFISYLDPDSNYLENPYLQRDLLYGFARLVRLRSSLLRDHGANNYLSAYLLSEDPIVRGLAVLCVTFLEMKEAAESLKQLLGDRTEIAICLYEKEALTTVSELAREALVKIDE